MHYQQENNSFSTLLLELYERFTMLKQACHIFFLFVEDIRGYRSNAISFVIYCGVTNNLIAVRMT